MRKKPVKPKVVSRGKFRPDPNRLHPPIGPYVQLPHQVRRAAAKADALVTGQPVATIPEPIRTRSKPKIALADAEIDAAMRHLECGDLSITGPHSSTIIELAREGARHLKARRDGARKERIKSESVTQRLEAVLQAFRKLSPLRQKYPTGSQTIQGLRSAVIQQLGLDDGDDIVSEDTIKQDIRQLRAILRAIQRGNIPPPGPKPVKRGLSEKTRQEMEAGKRAVAKAASAKKPRQTDR